MKPNLEICRKCPHREYEEMPDESIYLSCGLFDFNASDEDTTIAYDYDDLNKDFQPPDNCPYLLEHVIK